MEQHGRGCGRCTQGGTGPLKGQWDDCVCVCVGVVYVGVVYVGVVYGCM